jgi:DNA-binding transcriptional ArsR family regulator
MSSFMTSGVTKSVHSKTPCLATPHLRQVGKLEGKSRTRHDERLELPMRNASVTHHRVNAAAAALADPIRRDILRMLRDEPQSAGTVAQAFSVTRPAISRHLRVLREAGLVVQKTEGRTRIYRLELGPLTAIEEFISELRRDDAADWERHFMALDTEVHRVKRASKKHAQAVHLVGQPREPKKVKRG